MIIVDFDAPDCIRALARFDAQRLSCVERRVDLIGNGHLAVTIDQGNDLARYQGIVALHGQGLEHAAHQYYRQSAQIPTRVRRRRCYEYWQEMGRRIYDTVSAAFI